MNKLIKKIKNTFYELRTNQLKNSIKNTENSMKSWADGDSRELGKYIQLRYQRDILIEKLNYYKIQNAD